MRKVIPVILAPPFMVICYSSRRKPIHLGKTRKWYLPLLLISAGWNSPTWPHVIQAWEAKPGYVPGKHVRSWPLTVSAKFTEPFAKRLGRKIQPDSRHRMSLVRTQLLQPWTQVSSLGTCVLHISCTLESPEGADFQKRLFLSFPSDSDLIVLRWDPDPWGSF